MYLRSMFLAKTKKNVTIFHLEISVFTAVKYCSILHMHVCVMGRRNPCLQSLYAARMTTLAVFVQVLSFFVC